MQLTLSCTSSPWAAMTMTHSDMLMCCAFFVQVIDRAVDAVLYLNSLGCDDIECTAEDASGPNSTTSSLTVLLSADPQCV